MFAILLTLATLTLTTDARLIKSLPKIEPSTWNRYDCEFWAKFSPIHHSLASGDVSPVFAAEQFNFLLTEFLKSKDDLTEEAKEFFAHNPEAQNNLESARKLKNHLKKRSKQTEATLEDKAKAKQGLRHYNFLLKKKKESEAESEVKRHEKAFKKNFHKYAKEITNNTFGQPNVSPTFTKEEANLFYRERYSTPKEINLTNLSWFPTVTSPSIPYNLDPYRPRDIREALYKKSPSSSPGDDEILYGFLAKMPSTHHFLSTIFTKLRDISSAPPVWGSSKIILLHKGGNTSDPSQFRMISLTANVGKLYHSLESSRTMDFMIKNHYLDPTAQKAYIEGINGCVEHIQVVQEVIRHSRLSNHTAHMTWFDLTDAFGSVPHALIQHVLSYYNLPPQIISYIQDIYTKLKGRVATKDWESDYFTFMKGIFQGDPYSGTIFLIVFNPLIEHIKKFKDSQGYNLNGTRIITTPFADDFNIISKHIVKHQKLISDIEEKATSMGLTFKPSKCRSLSVVSGKPKVKPFYLKSTLENSTTPVLVNSVITHPHKFLGSVITPTCSPQDYFREMKQKMEEKLSNIDKAKCRGEYKLAVYERYALPSMRYHLSVHNLHKVHLDALDMLVKTYIKKWLNIPSRGVSDIGLFHPYMLNIKQPSTMYIVHGGPRWQSHQHEDEGRPRCKCCSPVPSAKRISVVKEIFHSCDM